jgi:hypothetical protein
MSFLRIGEHVRHVTFLSVCQLHRRHQLVIPRLKRVIMLLLCETRKRVPNLTNLAEVYVYRLDRLLVLHLYLRSISLQAKIK